MDTYFTRVKSIIERLRNVLKCQKCLQMKKENSMLFFHVCDHFYCVECFDNEKACPLCKNPDDSPTNVVNDKSILSLYQSLAKFELPSKQDIENIVKAHNESKSEKLNEKEEHVIKSGVEETPKNQTKSRLLRNRESRKNNLTSPDGADTILISSNESNITPRRDNNIINDSSSKRRKKNTTIKRESIEGNVTPIQRQNTASFTLGQQGSASLIKSAGSSKGSASVNKNNIKRNHKGETPLHLACKKSNFALMEKLINEGANPNARDNAGWTPLHDAVFSGNLEVMKFLLDHGANVNAPGLENTTALHEAIATENVKSVKLLLEYGADVNALNIFKETPMDLVIKYKLDEMKEVLSESSTVSKKFPQKEEEPERFLLYKYNLSIEDEKMVNEFAEKFEGEIIPSLTSKISPSHVVVSEGKVEISWNLISSVTKGCWIVTVDWIKESLQEGTPKPAGDYEPLSPSFSGFSKARTNKKNQLPALFSGCHFYFGGNFDYYTVKNLTIGKEDLKNLVEKNGGIILKRCPDPESLALEKTIPFHASTTGSLKETSYFIIYQTEKWDPKPKYCMSHMKTLPVEWLVCCVMRFELIDPVAKSWNEFL